MNVIEASHITKDYGNHKGVFDVTFAVEQGEVLGFLGPNGAGKTTTIRQLMGFIKPDQGEVKILGLDCFKECSQVQKKLGYLPGEIAFMDDMSGMEFIQFIANLKHVKDMEIAHQLIAYLELDPSGKLKKMSKGMKQKIGLVCAFMQNPDILILDEPTSGLDPLMQSKFVHLIKQAKASGKTILMSSHIFEEVEHTCDRVVILREGEVVANENMEELRSKKQKIYQITFAKEAELSSFLAQHPTYQADGKQVTIQLSGSVDHLVKELANYTIQDFSTRTQSLEELFMQYYGGSQK